MKNRCFADPSISKFGNQPIESSDAENVDLLRESKNAIAAIARVANIVPAGANVAIGVANQNPASRLATPPVIIHFIWALQNERVANRLSADVWKMVKAK